MTSATVDSTTTGYTYDGDGVRVAKETTDYLWDRESGLPMLVDDETNAYLHEDGALAQIDGANDPSYLLGDGLGSVRGVTDDAGDVVGTADYAVYGEVRASTGVSTLFRFTGEQFDAETGFTYLRARYMNPALGRFISADSVQPNAPGTQGWNVYAYVANNPTTWVDPSGHLVDIAEQYFNWITSDQVWVVASACAIEIPGCGVMIAGAAVAIPRSRQWAPIPFAAVGLALMLCGLTPLCQEAIRRIGDLTKHASPHRGRPKGECFDVPGTLTLSPDRLKNILDNHAEGTNATHKGPGNVSKPNSQFRWDATESHQIVRIIEEGVGLAVRKWKRVGDECRAWVRILSEEYIGWTYRTLFLLGPLEADFREQDTSCLLIRAKLVSPHDIHSAYPDEPYLC